MDEIYELGKDSHLKRIYCDCGERIEPPFTEKDGLAWVIKHCDHGAWMATFDDDPKPITVRKQ